MTKKRNPYQSLGVQKHASEAEIKAAFRRKAKKAHPDHGGSPDQFNEVKRACVVLLDPGKRAKFDLTGDIDEDHATPNPDQPALDVINSMLHAVLAGDVDPVTVPLVGQLISHLDKETGLIRTNISKMRRAVTRAEKLKKKFKKKRSKGRKDKGMMDSMLNWHAGQANVAIEKCELDLKSRARAREILSDYDFDMERAEPMSGWVTVTLG